MIWIYAEFRRKSATRKRYCGAVDILSVYAAIYLQPFPENAQVQYMLGGPKHHRISRRRPVAVRLSQAVRGKRRREVSRDELSPTRWWFATRDRRRDERPRRPTARSTTSSLSQIRAKGAEKLVQLLERLDRRIRYTGAGSVESFLRGIEFVQDQQRLAIFFLEGHRGDGPTVTTFVVGPDEARVRYHFDIPAEELVRFRGIVAEHETVPAADTNIHLAGTQEHAHRLRHPPLLEQLGLGPRLEHDARRTVESARDDELAIGRPFHSRAVLHRCNLTLSFCVHRVSPSVSVARQPCPARRSVSPSAGDASRARPSLPPSGAGRAGRSARARSSPW